MSEPEANAAISDGPDIPALPPIPMHLVQVLYEASRWRVVTRERGFALFMAGYQLEQLFSGLVDHADKLDNLEYWMERT